MQTRRDRVQAHTFVVGRLGTAMLEADPDAVDAPMRRTRTGSFIGLAIGALLCVGFLVFGLIFPGGAQSWRQEGRLIIEKETGATYLYSGGVLRPVANYASARLIQGAEMTVASVSSASLEGVPKGGTVGIAGAPDTLPAPEGDPQTWLLCAIPPTSEFDARTALTVTSGADVAALPSDFGVLVADPEGGRHLLWRGTRLRLDTDNGALEALGYGTSPVLPVTSAFLDTVPAAPDLAAPTVSGLGEEGPAIAGRPATVGQIFVVSGDGQPDQYYLLTRDGLAPLTATESRLLLTHPAVRAGAYGGETPAAISLTPADLRGVLAEDSTIDRPEDSPLPASPPELVPLDGDTACLRLGDDGGLGLAIRPVSDIQAWPVQEAPEIAPGCPTPDLMGIPSGGGALVEARPVGGSTETPTYYMVTDAAAKFPVSNPDTVGALGFDPGAATPVPTSLLRLIPTGPLLAPDAAPLPLAQNPEPPQTDCPE
ncbi:type VII secretion protein EccB [Marinactinospora thermotolerans]|uniref:Type VII secretion protein EccB n=1 Tax=Marinactinospora thermotolerans DSM 45154 TaxID=1122192 RepID=A0A1T4QC22_9ACTN|nr:type VII secretion protein EccB [Marinactinospora thermotolerans]SKA01177.1 type VII secretion protein EccB [Marinactinospora thermotolerans DSM 45154]